MLGRDSYAPDTEEMFSLFPHLCPAYQQIDRMEQCLKYCHVLLLYYNNLQK